MKKTLLLLTAILSATMFCFTSCKSGPTDEEIIADLGQKFMLALFTSNDELAKSICNKTGYETFETLGGMMALGTMGMNKDLDEAAILADLEVIEVKLISESKGVAQILCTLGDEPKTFAIPAEKDANGEWKVSVTKQSFN